MEASMSPCITVKPPPRLPCRHHRPAGWPDRDPVEPFTLYAIDGNGERFTPDPGDSVWSWLVVVVPAGPRTFKVVWMRPNMASIGRQLGAAGLLTSRLLMRQVERFHYDLERRDVRDGAPPVRLNRGLIQALA